MEHLQPAIERFRFGILDSLPIEEASVLREAGEIPARARRCNRGRSTH